jgi:hypothetical protein
MIGQLELRDMWDAPTPLGPVLVVFAAHVVLALAAGRLGRAMAVFPRWSGRVLFGLVALSAIKSSEIFHRWGILAGRGDGTLLSVETTWAILLGLNLLVLAAWVASKSHR